MTDVEIDRANLRARLRRFSVGIAGAGGLGSNAAMALARAGVGHLLVVDFDKVEESNLTRQYYFQDQIGLPKVEALKKNIERAIDDVTVEAVCQRLCPGRMAEPFSKMHVVVEALDTAQTKKSFLQEVMKALPGKPLVAASGVTGWGTCWRIETKKIGCLYMVCDKSAKSSDEAILLAPKVCAMANLQADMVLEILLGSEYVD